MQSTMADPLCAVAVARQLLSSRGREGKTSEVQIYPETCRLLPLLLTAAAPAPHLDVWPPVGVVLPAVVLEPARGASNRDRKPPLPDETRRKLPWRLPDPARDKRLGEAATGPDRVRTAGLEEVPHPDAGACSSNACAIRPKFADAVS